MAQPWSKEIRSLRAFGGQRNCWQVDFPARCRITRIIVRQTGGTLGAFTLKVFNSRRPCTGGSGSSGGVDDPDGYYEADPDAYKVMPTLNGDAAGNLEWFDVNGYPFDNKDGTSVVDREYFAYFEILPAGPAGLNDDRAYDLAFTCDMS